MILSNLNGIKKVNAVELVRFHEVELAYVKLAPVQAEVIESSEEEGWKVKLVERSELVKRSEHSYMNT